VPPLRLGYVRRLRPRLLIPSVLWIPWGLGCPSNLPHVQVDPGGLGQASLPRRDLSVPSFPCPSLRIQNCPSFPSVPWVLCQRRWSLSIRSLPTCLKHPWLPRNRQPRYTPWVQSPRPVCLWVLAFQRLHGTRSPPRVQSFRCLRGVPWRLEPTLHEVPSSPRCRDVLLNRSQSVPWLPYWPWAPSLPQVRRILPIRPVPWVPSLPRT